MKHFLRLVYRFGNSGILALVVVPVLISAASSASHAQAPSTVRIYSGAYPYLDHNQEPGYLGVKIVDVDADKAQALRLKDPHGAVITLVDHDAPAGKIGLRVNDVVLGLNGQPIKDGLDLRNLISGMTPGTKVSLQISRDGNILTVSATLVDRKAMEHEIWGKISPSPDPGQPPPQSGFLAGGDAPISGGFHMSIFTGSLRIGVMVEPLTSQMAEILGVKNGLMVKQVDHKSEAEAAGLHALDVILKVDSDTIFTTADWDRALRASAGKPMQISILRDKKEQTLTLQLQPKHRGAVEPKQLFGEDDGALVD